MRLFLEVLIFAAMITLAWDRTFRDRATEIPLIGPRIFAASPTPAPATAPAVRAVNSPVRPPRATVRAGLPDTEAPAAAPAYAAPRAVPASSANGSWMWDAAHRGTLDNPKHKPPH